MLLVIFGAGASFDSSSDFTKAYDQAYRPPLASQLFDLRFGNVAETYHQCLPIIPQLRRPSSVEQELQNLLQEAESIPYPLGHVQLAAIRYYLQEVLWTCTDQWMKLTKSVTNYRVLVDKILRRKKPHQKVGFVTFNYDLLLDRALQHAGYSFPDIPSYVASDLMLIKPHGAVNWGHKVIETGQNLTSFRHNRKDLALHLIETISHLKVSPEFTLIDEHPPAIRDGHAVIPALAIPTVPKRTFECSEAHLGALNDFLPDVTHILIIGWRATEQSFLELLREGIRNNTAVMIVNGKTRDEDEAEGNMRQARIPISTYINQGLGFTDFMLNDAGRLFMTI